MILVLILIVILEVVLLEIIVLIEWLASTDVLVEDSISIPRIVATTLVAVVVSIILILVLESEIWNVRIYIVLTRIVKIIIPCAIKLSISKIVPLTKWCRSWVHFWCDRFVLTIRVIGSLIRQFLP